MLNDLLLKSVYPTSFDLIYNKLYIMCVICSVIEKDYIESALVVESTISGDTMAIPLRAPLEAFHSFEAIQAMLINANLLAIMF